MKILLIEDEKRTVNFLTKGLKEESYIVSSASDGVEGLNIALNGDFDAIILDINLPKMDGVQVCRSLREKGRKTPVIMLTARETVDHRIEGLDSGADDYMIKPFSFAELLARLRALTRRNDKIPQIISVGDLKMDLITRRITYREQGIDLTSREYNLLQLFMRRTRHILSHTLIFDSAWGMDFDPETNVLEVYVNLLRKKLLKMTGKNWIKTHRGLGYSFDDEE